MFSEELKNAGLGATTIRNLSDITSLRTSSGRGDQMEMDQESEDPIDSRTKEVVTSMDNDKCSSFEQFDERLQNIIDSLTGLLP